MDSGGCTVRFAVAGVGYVGDLLHVGHPVQEDVGLVCEAPVGNAAECGVEGEGFGCEVEFEDVFWGLY